MKNFLDISGLARFILNWYNRIFGFHIEPIIVQEGIDINGIMYERTYSIDFNITPGFISYPLFDYDKIFLAVVPEKTLFIANIPNEVRFNSLTIQDCFQSTENTSGTIALCIMNNRVLLGKAA